MRSSCSAFCNLSLPSNILLTKPVTCPVRSATSLPAACASLTTAHSFLMPPMAPCTIAKAVIGSTSSVERLPNDACHAANQDASTGHHDALKAFQSCVDLLVTLSAHSLMAIESGFSFSHDVYLNRGPLNHIVAEYRIPCVTGVTRC